MRARRSTTTAGRGEGGGSGGAKEAYTTDLEEATRRAIEEFERDELARWPGFSQTLAQSATEVPATTPPPPQAPPMPKLVEEELWSWTSTMPVHVSRPAVWVGTTDEEAGRYLLEAEW